MPVYRVFQSECSDRFALQVHHTDAGLVSVEVNDANFEYPYCVEICPDDIPALIAELRRVAKLAKEARDG